MTNMPNLSPVMNVQELNAFLAEVFPQLDHGRGTDGEPSLLVTRVAPGEVDMRLRSDARHIRPGGTISGPALFTLADVTGYGLVLSHIGGEALAVTTNLNINFMRKAAPGIVTSEGRLLKLGRQLAVFDAVMKAEGEVVAHATGTYAIPPKRKV